jgi:hypothetical protein
MIPKQFPPLARADWQPTRDTLHGYALIAGAVRGALSPSQKYSSHRSLLVAAAGLTTSPIPAGPFTFELLLDLSAHRLVLTTSHGRLWQQRLRGQSQAAFFDEVMGALAAQGISLNLDRTPYANAAAGVYDVAAVERFCEALSQIDQVLKRFKGELRQETSAVQLWPHHLDLAVLWFSGRRVPGQENAKPSFADEQMNFGFSTGDGGIPEPYFYITAYPLPPALAATPVPPGAQWHTEGWSGAVLPYAQLVGAADAEERLLTFLRAYQGAGMALMKGSSKGPGL